ncbi:protein-L-isoaspartate O-methyltransferase [Candidatus Micrarchaeota archaeon]|nr:protein-L-isoaspartate O-methyltransferase [Candidatus Micrarchaeota archaeon]
MSNLEMVEYLKRQGYLKSKRVESALLATDRADFTGSPYCDSPQPVARGQTISAPSVVAFMLEHLDVRSGMKVLEIGTGSGYNTALLSRLVESGKVISFEFYDEVFEVAEKNLKNFKNVEIYLGDGSAGHEKQAPYDRIIVTAAMPSLDDDHPLIRQLKHDGKLVAPVGSRYHQDIVVFDNSKKTRAKVLPVIFVPLRGKLGFTSI